MPQTTNAKPPSPAKKPRRASRPPAMRTVSLVSLGCPKNLVDSEKMLGLLAEAGLTPISYDPASEDFSGADAVVINTCGFLEASKEESLGVIKEAIASKERGEVRRVVVAGCLVQRHRAKMLEWAPGIDAMVGVFDRDKIVEAVQGPTSPAVRTAGLPGASDGAPTYWIAGNALVAAKERGLKTAGLTVHGKDAKGVGYFEDDSARLRLTPRHYSYLRISEGCNQNCAFCTIPSIRGKMRSKPLDRIVQEARELVHDGAFELLLIGQDTTSFGDDIGIGLKAPSPREGVGGGFAPPPLPAGEVSRGSASDGGGPKRPTPRTVPLALHSSPPSRPALADIGGLPALLHALSDAMDDLGCKGWIRLMYAYPSNFSRPIIDAFAHLTRHGRLLPYLDIPLQHASDRVLSAMRRNVTRRQQEDLIAALRESVPGMAIRTTFISGFPGESERDHQDLLEFVERMRFEALGVFEYSHEPGTVAGTMEDDPKLAVAPEKKARRRAEVMQLQQKIAFEKAASIASAFDEKRPLHPDGTIRGHTFDVLIDELKRTSAVKTSGVTDGGRLYAGRTYFQAPQIDALTYVQSREKLAPGELVRCVVVGSDAYDLIARPVAEVEKRVGLKVLR